jgi:hypothetical protein
MLSSKAVQYGTVLGLFFTGSHAAAYVCEFIHLIILDFGLVNVVSLPDPRGVNSSTPITPLAPSTSATASPPPFPVSITPGQRQHLGHDFMR